MKQKLYEIFNEFSISRDPIYRVDSGFIYFKGMDHKIRQDPIGPDRRQVSEVRFEYNQLINLVILSLKNVDKKSKLSNFEAARRLPK